MGIRAADPEASGPEKAAFVVSQVLGANEFGRAVGYRGHLPELEVEASPGKLAVSAVLAPAERVALTAGVVPVSTLQLLADEFVEWGRPREERPISEEERTPAVWELDQSTGQVLRPCRVAAIWAAENWTKVEGLEGVFVPSESYQVSEPPRKKAWGRERSHLSFSSKRGGFPVSIATLRKAWREIQRV